MNAAEAADYLHAVSIDPAMKFSPMRRARLGEVVDVLRAVASGIPLPPQRLDALSEALDAQEVTAP